AMLLNWMALRNQEPQVRPWVDRLILRFLPADVVNDEYELTAELPVRTFFRQPMPLRLHVGYWPLDTGGAEEIRIQLALSRGAGRILASREVGWPAGEVRRQSLELPTDGLGDGVYSLRVRSSLDGQGWTERVLTVRLCGQAHAAELAWRDEQPAAWARAQRVNERLRGFVGNYAVMPRNDDEEATVDIDELVRLCREAGLDTFDWTLSRRYEDFVEFLDVADEEGIDVWATLSSPRSMATAHDGGYPPHYTDYHAWAEELARLSLAHPSLVAWVIDDFDGDTGGVLTQGYVAEMVAKQRAINPELAFVPVIYTEFIRHTPDWMLRWGRHTDGIMWPYRPLEQTDDLAEEAADARACVGPNHGLYINVYCTSTSWHRQPPTGDYVASAMRIAGPLTDGMRLYCLPWSETDSRHRAAVQVIHRWEAG
ncbi:MAG: hypothetical protein U9R79_18455, partial [Armatimonadota bacterium]|nr:hypothetical protein [Armatimonadota bacterium]